jgi:hypothetical protein
MWILGLSMIGGIVSHGHAQSITIHGGHYWGMPIIEKMVETFEKNQPDIVLEVANVNDHCCPK